MARFLIRRIALGILVMWMVTVLVFGIFFVGPGPDSVARRIAGKNATPQTVQLIRVRLHLNQPIVVQYWDFLKQLVWHHNLGYSYYHEQPVTSVLKQAFPITFSLAIGAADHLVGARGAVGRAVGRAAGLGLGPVGPPRWRCSSIRCRRSSSGCCCCGSSTTSSPSTGIKWFPGQGYTLLHRESAQLVPKPGAAVDHAGPGLGGRLHPADTRVPAGGPR